MPEVGMEVQPPKTMFLRESVASGTLREEEYEVGRVMGGGFYVRARERYVMISMADLIRGAFKALDEGDD